MGAGLFWLLVIGGALYVFGRDALAPRKRKKKRRKKTSSEAGYWRVVARGTKAHCSKTAGAYTKSGRQARAARIGNEWVTLARREG